MAREDEIIKKATSYATIGKRYDENGDRVPAIDELRKYAFIAGAKWADEHPSLESTQYKYIMQGIQEKIDHLECSHSATWDEILTWFEEQHKVIEIPGKEGGNDAIWCVNALRIGTDGQDNIMKRCESAKKWLCEIMEKLYKE